MGITSVSLPEESLKDLARIEEAYGLRGRSEAVRASISAAIAEIKEAEDLQGDVEGVLVIVRRNHDDPWMIRLQARYEQAIKTLQELAADKIPTMGICLGHQILALAHGFKTTKLKYGHRGANHPVKNLETGRVYISSQNHGYVVDVDKLDRSIAEPAFMNVNDGTNEGLKYVGKNIFTVQFHPEACPGPQDTGYLFDRFIEMMEAQNA